MNKFLTFLSLLALYQGSLAEKCPFDSGNNCDCIPEDPPSSSSYRRVQCRPNGRFNPFISASQYNISAELMILTDLSNVVIPANSFAAFNTVNQLYFSNTQLSTIVPLSLDPAAFARVQLYTLAFDGFRGLFPLPEAVRTAGKNGLVHLSIKNSNAAALNANQFQDFTRMKYLAIDSTQITSISDNAFSGLESLQVLSLISTYIYTYPLQALSKLTNLAILDLTGNYIAQWPSSAFASFTSLQQLQLSRNFLQNAIDSGAFNGFPQTVDMLDLSEGSLRQVPRSILDNMPEVNMLKLAGNEITYLNKNDFPENSRLFTLDLSNNPISGIDAGAFQPLKLIWQVTLEQTAMDSIDLSLFNGLDHLQILNFDYQRTLQFDLTVSDPDHVSQGLEMITLSYNGLNGKIDPNLQKIVSRQDFQHLNLKNDLGITCDSSLSWMAKYVLCPNSQKVNVTGAGCSNLLGGVLLGDYLKQFQGPC